MWGGAKGQGTTRMTERSRRIGRSGDYRQVFINTTKILAAPIELCVLSRDVAQEMFTKPVHINSIFRECHNPAMNIVLRPGVTVCEYYY